MTIIVRAVAFVVSAGLHGPLLPDPLDVSPLQGVGAPSLGGGLSCELVVAGQALAWQVAGRHGGGDGAARLDVMGAVGESAVGSQRVDVGERLVESVRREQPEAAKPRGVDDYPAAGQRQQLP